MLFRNTSAPSNPFASEASLISSIYSKGFKKPPERHLTNTYNYNTASTSKLGIYDKGYWNNRQQTNINEIKQDNPFDRCTNLQDLVREGLQEKHEYERSRRHSQSPFKSNYIPGLYKGQSSKFLDASSNGYKTHFGEYRPTSSSSYIPSSYIPYTSEYSNYNEYGNGSCYGSSSYIPPPSTYVPLVPSDPLPTAPVPITEPQLEKKPSKFKPINGLNQSSHYSFDMQQRTSNAESISEYFPNPRQQPNIKLIEPIQPLQKKDSVMSNYSQKQSFLRGSLSKKPSIRSNDMRFSSGDQRQTFGMPSKRNPKMQSSDDPFEQLNPNNANFAYQSFVQEKSPWPQFIELSNQKFYFKALKPKPKTRLT